MLKWIQPPACADHGAHLFDEKICQSTVLFWFRLRDDGILYSRAVIQRTIDVSPTFLIAVWAHKNRDPNQRYDPNSRRLRSFLHDAAQNFEFLNY